MASKKQRKAYTKEERKMHILTTLAVNVQSGGEGQMTCKQIADALHITASTHLRIILNEMVVDKQLSQVAEADPGIAGFRRVYFLHPGSTYGRAIQAAKKAAGYVKESKEQRDARLMAAINRTNGQMNLFVEHQNA